MFGRRGRNVSTGLQVPCALVAAGTAWATGSVEASASSAGGSTAVCASAVSGLDVDSDDGASSSVAGSRVGVSSSVFRVMLSGSGLRTFGMTAAPDSLARRRCCCRRVASCAPRWRGNAVGRDLGNREPVIRGSFTRDGASSQRAGGKATRLLGKHQAGNGWLEGGRS